GTAVTHEESGPAAIFAMLEHEDWPGSLGEEASGRGAQANAASLFEVARFPQDQQIGFAGGLNQLRQNGSATDQERPIDACLQSRFGDRAPGKFGDLLQARSHEIGVQRPSKDVGIDHLAGEGQAGQTQEVVVLDKNPCQFRLLVGSESRRALQSGEAVRRSVEGDEDSLQLHESFPWLPFWNALARSAKILSRASTF